MKRYLPILPPLLFMFLCLIVEIIFQKWNAVIPILIISGIYLVFAGLLIFLANLREGKKQKKQDPAPDPESFAGFWSGMWIKSKGKGKKGWVPRFLFALIPFVLFFGAAAWDFFSDGFFADKESTLVFLAWVIVGLGSFAAMIYKDAKRKGSEEEVTKNPEGSPTYHRREQLDEWLKNGLIDKQEYQALRIRAEQEETGDAR